jgi:hypothetical protein
VSSQYNLTLDCTFIDAPNRDSPPKVEKLVKPSHGSKPPFNNLHIYTNRTFDILIKENHMNYSRKTEDVKTPLNLVMRDSSI